MKIREERKQRRGSPVQKIHQHLSTQSDQIVPSLNSLGPQVFISTTSSSQHYQHIYVNVRITATAATTCTSLT